jgi:TonB family protein
MPEEQRLLLRINDEEYGPFNVEEVKEWIDEGKFSPDDYIQIEGKAHWIRAKNITHLKKLFDSRKKEEIRGAFANWLGMVESGETPTLTRTGISDERERLDEERENLERARKELEEREGILREQVETELTEKQQEEIERLESERDTLQKEKERIEEAEMELSEMEKKLKKRRRIPIIISAIVIGIVLIVGIPIIINQYQKSVELQKKIDRLDELSNKISKLEKRLLTAETPEEREKIKDELEELQEEKEKLSEELGEGETKEIEPEIETTLGSVSISGPLSITGEGSEDLTRSSNSISSGVRGVMGTIQSRYNQELKSNPDLEGKVIVRFTIAENGSVTSASVVSSTIGNSAIESTITSSLRSAKFQPSSMGTTTVTYPFYFETK